MGKTKSNLTKVLDAIKVGAKFTTAKGTPFEITFVGKEEKVFSVNGKPWKTPLEEIKKAIDKTENGEYIAYKVDNKEVIQSWSYVRGIITSVLGDEFLVPKVVSNGTKYRLVKAIATLPDVPVDSIVFVRAIDNATVSVKPSGKASVNIPIKDCEGALQAVLPIASV